MPAVPNPVIPTKTLLNPFGIKIIILFRIGIFIGIQNSGIYSDSENTVFGITGFGITDSE